MARAPRIAQSAMKTQGPMTPAAASRRSRMGTPPLCSLSVFSSLARIGRVSLRDRSLPSTFVRLEVDDGVGTIRLDRPPVNAMNALMQDQLHAVALEATARDDVRAVVIYGGTRSFAAGADVKEMAAMTHAEMVARVGASTGCVHRGRARSPSPSSPRSPATRSAGVVSWRSPPTCVFVRTARSWGSRKSCSA